MSKTKTTKQQKGLSSFEEMLLWTSYRYCIGRRSYVVGLADEYPVHFYDKMSDNQKRHMAQDIRKEIMDRIRFGYISMHISRWDNNDEFNPIKVLMKFIDAYNVKSIRELATYSTIEYDAHKDKFEVVGKLVSPTKYIDYVSNSDIDDLLPWETLASAMDIDNYKTIVTKDGTEVKAFKTFVRKTMPIEGQPGYYRNADFGWEEVWKPVDDFVKGKTDVFIPDEIINEVKDIDKEEAKNS